MTLTTDQLFRQARTATFFLESPGVDDDTLRALYKLLKWGPTASNCLGRADATRQRPRNPRLPFEQACRLA